MELSKKQKQQLSYITARSLESLGHYKSCLKKMDLYREKIQCGTGEWKKLTSHQKTWAANDDR